MEEGVGWSGSLGLVDASSYLFFSRFLGLSLQHMEAPRLGIKSDQQLLAYIRPMRDPRHICDYIIARGNAGSLTHWVRPGIELVGFVTIKPQWELPNYDT